MAEDDRSLNIPEPYLSAHKRTAHNREQVLASRWVGCIYCLLIYSPRSIHEWTDRDETPICPVCSVDAVMPLTTEEFDSDFLPQMRRYWFGDPRTEIFFKSIKTPPVREVTKPS